MKRRYRTRPLPLHPRKDSLYRGTSPDGRRFWFRIDYVERGQVYFRRWQFIGRKRTGPDARRMTLQEWAHNVTKARRGK